MGSKIKIAADSAIPFLKGALEPYADIIYLPAEAITRESAKDVDGLIIRTRTKCNEQLLAGTKIRIIATATIGFDHIDTAYCESQGIKWVNAPGCNSNSVKQYMASALLEIAKQKCIVLSNQTIGIIGVGNVGSKVEKLAKIFGMNILLNDPPRERKEKNQNFVSLDFLIAKSDIITFHVPLTYEGEDKTFHLADENLFERFSSEKIFINTSRGEIVKENELKKAIKAGKVIGVVLDVWENEPIIDNELLTLVDIATPHIAGYSIEGKANAAAACVNALNDFFSLGLEKDWYPKELPRPEKSNLIEINCNNKTNQDILYESVLSTYNIFEDDQRLRDSVQNFEKHRIDYIIRREFPFFKVKLYGADAHTINQHKELGFTVL